MKKTLLLFAASGLIYVSLSSYSSGPAASQGAQVAKNGCGGCHGGQGSNASMTITLLEGTTPVTSGLYKPGGVYTVRVNQNTPGASVFGYVALITTDKDDAQAGTLANAQRAANVKITNSGNYQMAEHPSAQATISGGTSFSFQWTAPAGKGDVTIYAVVNSCNGNQSADPGDTYALKTLKLKEGWPASVDNVESGMAVNVYPNPASGILNIALQHAAESNYTIVNLNGAVVAQGTISNKQTAVDVSMLPAGMHFVKVGDKTVAFNKQ